MVRASTWHSRCNEPRIMSDRVSPSSANASTSSNLVSDPARSVSEPATAADIVALIGAFLGFLDAREPERAAQLWDVPGLILGDTHVHGPMSLDRLASWLRDIDTGAADTPPSYGTDPAREDSCPSEGFEPLIQRPHWLSERVVTVEVRWPRRPRGGLLAGVDGTTFLIRVDQLGQAKIRGVLLHSTRRSHSSTAER
jgi:hypothetical protein